MEKIKVSINLGETACSLYNISLLDYSFNPDIISKVAIDCCEEFDLESINIGISNRGMCEALGGKLKYFDNSLSIIEKPVVNYIDDIEKMKPVDMKNDGRYPIILEALKISKSKTNNKYPIIATIIGSFTNAINICGASNLLRWTKKYPFAVKKLLDKITYNTKLYIDECSTIGCYFYFAEPASSTTLISPEQFKEFSYPYLNELINYTIKKSKIKPGLHICGRSKPIWKMIKKLEILSFSLDNIENLEELKNELGNYMRIAGNVAPVEVLYNGSIDDIDHSIRECILKGWDSPKGYTLTTGCQVPFGTPRKNIEYFLKRGRELTEGKLDFEQLQKGF